jgi:hypothetical protein
MIDPGANQAAVERSVCTGHARGVSSRECALAWRPTSALTPTLVRLAFALFTVFGGIGVLLYLVAWVVIPEEGGDGASIAESFVNKRRS